MSPYILPYVRFFLQLYLLDWLRIIHGKNYTVDHVYIVSI